MTGGSKAGNHCGRPTKDPTLPVISTASQSATAGHAPRMRSVERGRLTVGSTSAVSAAARSTAAIFAQPAGLVAVETGRRAAQLDGGREPVLLEGLQVLGPALPDPSVDRPEQRSSLSAVTTPAHWWTTARVPSAGCVRIVRADQSRPTSPPIGEQARVPSATCSTLTPSPCPALRVLRYRARHPPGAHPRRHRSCDRSLAHPTRARPAHGPRRRPPALPIPPPRPPPRIRSVTRRWPSCCTHRGSACRPTPKRSRAPSIPTATGSSATSTTRRASTSPPGSR